MSSEYFEAQARDVMERAGGDPGNAGPLAAWAEDARLRRDWQRLGVIVAYDGTLVAETIRLNVLAGVSVTLPSDSLKKLGDVGSGIAITMVVPDPNRAKTQVVRDYQSAMRANGKQEFTQGSLEAYVNMRVLAEGLERAGSDPTRAKLRSALAGIRNWDLGGFVVDYSGQAPYVGSRYVDLGVLGGSGRFLG